MKERSFRKFIARLDEMGLHQELHKRTLTFHVTLKELYDGGREPSVIAARRAVYSWLMKEKGRGLNEVARLFDRAPTGVAKMVRS